MSKSLKIKLIAIFGIFAVSLFNYKLIFADHFSLSYTYNYKLVFITALALGIIIATAIYNLTLFVYLRSSQHLYYGFAQLFTFLFLINLDSLNIKPFDEIFGFKSEMFVDIYQILMLIFSMLFISEFSKNYIRSKLDYMVKIIIYIAVLDLILTFLFSHSILSKLIPIFVPIWLVLSELYRLSKKKDIPLYYLMVGWGVVLVIVAIEYLGFIDLSGFVFPFFHIALAIDSIMLSLAISYKFKLIEDDRKLQQSLLLQRSRLASMGEMISIIAHQWRQPLNFLSFSLMSIKKECNPNEKTQKTIKEASEQIQYMSKTIESFRNFYNPSKTKENFDIKQAIQNAINLSQIKDIDLMVKNNFTTFANKNEFEQVILNLLNNAKEASTSNLAITITVDKPKISIKDNCGGIKKENQTKVFEPYFSTKEESDGIGLYIAKTIIEGEMGGKLSLKSDTKGSIFTIELDQSISYKL
jgi:signal transduction histidine kinase